MSTPADPTIQLLEVLDDMLTAALREVRRARALGPAPTLRKSKADKSKSNTELCVDVLMQAATPLHISALVDALARKGAHTSRDSLVSALTKRLAPSGPFVRTAANTFGLAGRDKPLE